MAKLFRKGKVKKIVAIVLGLVSVAGAVFGVSALAKYAKEEQKTIKPTFSVGGLTETGVYEETDDTIYTKDSFEAKGLEIKLDFDSNVKYQVFWYDNLGRFSHASEVFNESMEFYTPADYTVRLEVTPVWDEGAMDEEKEIAWYQVAKYAAQIEVRVDKNQSISKSDYIKVPFTSDLLTYHEGKYYNVKSNSLENVETYNTVKLINDGSFSLVYLDYDDKGSFIDLLMVLENGDVKSFALSNNNLPTYDDPLRVPNGATVYVTSNITETYFKSFNLMLY